MKIPTTKAEAIEAVTTAAWIEQPKPEDATCGHRGCEDHPGEGRKMIHVLSGFGMDMPLDHVLGEIGAAREVWWDPEAWLGHQLAAATAEGRVHRYEVKAPTHATAT